MLKLLCANALDRRAGTPRCSPIKIEEINRCCWLPCPSRKFLVPVKPGSQHLKRHQSLKAMA